MRCSNAVDANLREWLKSHIASTHDGLADVVDAVVAVVNDFVGRIVLDGLRLVGIPDKVETVQLVEHADAVHLARVWAVGCGQARRQIVGVFVWDFDDAVTWRHQALPGIVGAVADSAVEAVWLEDHGGVKDDYKLALAMDLMFEDSEGQNSRSGSKKSGFEPQLNLFREELTRAQTATPAIKSRTLATSAPTFQLSHLLPFEPCLERPSSDMRPFRRRYCLSSSMMVSEDEEPG